MIAALGLTVPDHVVVRICTLAATPDTLDLGELAGLAFAEVDFVGDSGHVGAGLEAVLLPRVSGGIHTVFNVLAGPFMTWRDV